MNDKKYYLDNQYRLGDNITPLGLCSNNNVVVRQKIFIDNIKNTGIAHSHDVIAAGFTQEYFLTVTSPKYMVELAQNIDFDCSLD